MLVYCLSAWLMVETFYEHPFRPIPGTVREIHIAVDMSQPQSAALHRELTESWFLRVPKQHRLNPDILLLCCKMESRRLLVLSFFEFKWHDYGATRFGVYPQFRVGRDQWQSLPLSKEMAESPAWTEFFEDFIDDYYSRYFASKLRKINTKLWDARSPWQDYDNYDEYGDMIPGDIRTLTPVSRPTRDWDWSPRVIAKPTPQTPEAPPLPK